MEIESNRLILKEISWNDADEIHHLHSFPEVVEYSTFGIPENIEITKERIRPMIKAQSDANRKYYDWKIILKDTKEFIGLAGISLSLNKFKLGEIYYELLPDYWGKGYATEISKLLIKAGFEEFHLHKVEAGIATENTKSIRVMKKSGMIREGLRRKILPIRGKWKDNYHYAIVEDDPRDE